MFEDEDAKKPTAHEVGMPLDTLSVEELTARIVLLEHEIARLRAAIEEKGKTRSQADSIFKF
ncbi:DUF1192 domain-containing protein [Devosia nitrariae]|uniref:DUF1192 domain-containing protein n=1 Tax=Devosia nitrariae TaxID=2071872 RepID=A0ABQ5W9R5_9HYPH|nr:DUF1192 domain-containing protein [Devosia nitrariae]GLQ56844.1 hypothetical protein GCM10010862_41030 [Devosia nitrariae]